ncbi:MAG: DUF4185 domain-containing protein [Myxococcales bacterium]|nr:DUF4185 domain-containing protein [Myxococcales bacterium]
MRSAGLLLSVLVAAAASSACGGGEPALVASSWPEADALLHADPRWLGADAAYTVGLGGSRVLWLFGDTFLAREPGGGRGDALFLRNSIAVQTGLDPSRALISFSWGAAPDGERPGSFLAEDGADWFWPGGGARLGGSLLLFYGRIRAPAGDPHGFQRVGWRAILVGNPDEDPSAWNLRDAIVTESGSLAPGNAVLVVGDRLYAYAETSDSVHDIYLVRWAVTDAARGDLSAPEWWCGGGWQRACARGPAVVVPTGAPELSVQPGGPLAPYLMVQTEGYGAATLALRAAPAPEGPWSAPRTFFRPPESREVSQDVVYAGKGHPELAGPDVVSTYVSADLYYPRFVRASYAR